MQLRQNDQNFNKTAFEILTSRQEAATMFFNDCADLQRAISPNKTGRQANKTLIRQVVLRPGIRLGSRSPANKTNKTKKTVALLGAILGEI